MSYEIPRDGIKNMSLPGVIFGPSSPVAQSVAISICSIHKGIRKDIVEMDITDAYKRGDNSLVPASTKNRPADEEESSKFLTVPVMEAGKALRTEPCTNKPTILRGPPKRPLSSHLKALLLETIGEDECEIIV